MGIIPIPTECQGINDQVTAIKNAIKLNKEQFDKGEIPASVYVWLNQYYNNLLAERQAELQACQIVNLSDLKIVDILTRSVFNSGEKKVFASAVITNTAGKAIEQAFATRIKIKVRATVGGISGWATQGNTFIFPAKSVLGTGDFYTTPEAEFNHNPAVTYDNDYFIRVDTDINNDIQELANNNNHLDAVRSFFALGVPEKGPFEYNYLIKAP